MFSLRNFNNLSNITALKGSKRNEHDILAFALVIHKLSDCYPYNEIRGSKTSAVSSGISSGIIKFYYKNLY